MNDTISNNIEELKEAPLFKFVNSYRNIYRAIYALESYIDELYLLDTKVDKSDDREKVIATNSLLHNISDLELYYILHDKYNWDIINTVIKVCQTRIEDIIINPDEYFETSVFFSLKKYDEDKDKVVFRPLHTAALIDQICMVAMLQVLMFEDSDEMEVSSIPRRCPSDLLKSIPDNFYGNRGSLNLERIYERWVPNYQAYNRKIVESCDKYSRSHKYEYEVSLDIKEFFPSISPFYLFVKICDVLREKYRNKVFYIGKTDDCTEEGGIKHYNDMIFKQNFNILNRITAKLLFLKIKDGNKVLDSVLEYYGSMTGEIKEFPIKYDGNLFAKGVAQGLPQSYFFGNLCMTDVRRKIMAENMFQGKDYFYVDDSVIYVKGFDKKDFNKADFDEKIKNLNEDLGELTSIDELEKRWSGVSKEFRKENSSLINDLKECAGKAVEFHEKLSDVYKIIFHDKKKSKIQTIDDADREIKSMGGLGRNASGMNSFHMDADDRRISRDKMNALNDYAWMIIKEIESSQEKEDNNEHKEEIDNDKNELQLKVFKRFRKIFLSRNMWLDTMDSGKVEKALEDWFLKLLTPEGLEIRKVFSSPTEMAEEFDELRELGEEMMFDNEKKKLWFELTDKEAFRAEALQLLKCSPLDYAEKIKRKIMLFEESFSGIDKNSYSHLYFHRYLEGVISERTLSGERYESLHKSFQRNFPAAVNIDTAKAIDRLREFIHQEYHFIFTSDKASNDGNKSDVDSTSPVFGVKEEVYFIEYISDEFKRRILNAYFSVLVGVNPSEEMPFVKTRGGSIDYAAFRILVWLRNPNFEFRNFWHFLSKIESHALPERMIVDNGLPEVVKIFIRQVSDPEKVDSLIVTHRIVKGLWQNGSKFLNSYTLHNEEHAVKLIKLSMDIIRRIDYFQLKQLDYYILFLACYLHDISMVIHPDLQYFCHTEERNIELMNRYLIAMRSIVKEWDDKVAKADNPEWFVSFWKSFGVKMTELFKDVYDFFESDIRTKHPKESALFIKNKRYDLFQYLDETIVEAVAKAGEDHGKDICNVYDIRSSAMDDVVSNKYISILLRLADLMDVSNDRINYHLLNENVNHLSATSKFHWISHLITDEIALIPNYEIDYESIKNNMGKEIRRYFIRETLRFYLILNMKSMEPIEREGDRECGYWCKTVYNQKLAPIRYKDFEGITLRFEDRPCMEIACPMVCRWMNNKHNWLFPELARLQKYLNTVNYEPFRTEIEVNILFKDFSDINLKPSLFDDVRRYLKNEYNE